MTVLAGLFWIYGPIGILATLLWCWPVRRLIALWTGRDVMLSFIPESRHVAHTERILGVRTRPTGRTH